MNPPFCGIEKNSLYRAEMRPCSPHVAKRLSYDSQPIHEQGFPGTGLGPPGKAKKRGLHLLDRVFCHSRRRPVWELDG